MRRYIKAFSKDEDSEKEEHMMSAIETPQLRLKKGFNNRAQAAWGLIRNSALGLETEQEEPEDDQDIKYV